MYAANEYLLQAIAAERERQIAQLRQAVGARRSPTASEQLSARVQAPASRRLLRLLAELYGKSTPTADPALYDRLAWSGADGEDA